MSRSLSSTGRAPSHLRAPFAAAALLTLAALAIALAGCSSTSSPADGAAGSTGAGGATGQGGATPDGGGGGSDGGADADGGNDACASATAQGTCSGEGTICSQGCTGADICQFCNLLRCTSGRWQPEEVAPAPCFACGPEKRCQINAEYCHAMMGGFVGNPPSYQCLAVPAACRPTPTCDCLVNQSVAGAANCQQAGSGQLTVTLLVP